MVELSSLDVRALALELRPLEGAYVDKVYETEGHDLVVKLRHPDHGPAHLLIRPGSFLIRVDHPPVSPEAPTTVAMTLRKLLTGARLRRIDQHEFDRVLRLSVDRRGDAFEIVVELFGKGNLIVVGPDGVIVFALRTETFAHRTVKRGERLVFPPARVNPTTLPRPEFDAMVARSEKDVVRFLALDVALGGDLAEELVHRAGLDKSAKAAALEPEEVERLWTRLRELLDRPGTRPGVATTAKGIQVQAIAFEAPLFHAAAVEPAATLSEAVLHAAEAEQDAVPAAVDEEAARLERQIGHQERGIQELGIEAERWERRGHALYANYATAALVLQKSKATVEASSWDRFQARIKARDAAEETWMKAVVAVDPKRARIVAKLGDEELPLDPFLSVEQNATVLYDESKRIRAKQEGAREAVEEARKRLMARRAAAPTAKAKRAGPRAPAKRFWFEGHRWFYSSESFLVVGGRDAASNEKLVKRHLKAGDWYCHADVHGAASVIVKGEGRVPGEATMKEACQFAAVNSKAFAQFAAADAFWVTPEQVSKTGETGQFVPKGSFVVRGARRYVPKVKMELALGIVRLDAQGRPDPEGTHERLMGGPPEAVRHHTPRVAMIERGDLKPTDAAKTLAPLFGVTIDEVVASLPAGTLRVVSAPEARR